MVPFQTYRRDADAIVAHVWRGSKPRISTGNMDCEARTEAASGGTDARWRPVLVVRTGGVSDHRQGTWRRSLDILAAVQ